MEALRALSEQLPSLDQQLQAWEASSTQAAHEVQRALMETVGAAGGGAGAVSSEVAIVMQSLQDMLTRRQRWLAASRERLGAISQVGTTY